VTRRRASGSLRREIVLWYSVVLLVAVSAFGGLTFVLLRQALQWAGRTSLRQTAQAVEDIYVPRGVPRVGVQEQIYEVPRANAEVVRRRTVLATGDTVETWLARNDRMEERALSTFVVIALVLIPLTTLLAALGGRALLERLLAPLERLVDTTRTIGIGDLSRRVEEPARPDELYELAHSFNGMLTRLERAVQALRRFSADASHELRTPLTSIRGTVQVALARERTEEELEETLAEVLEETEWMLHLVDGLLTLARGEEGGAVAGRQPVDLGGLLEDVAEVARALAAGKPVAVELSVPPGLVVEGSPGPLRQVFLNLASNAVKFTDRGRVEISARRAEEGWVEVSVSDTGVGIPAAELPRVFDRFYRGDAARAQPGGTGLGLAIARLLLEQHEGTISVRSEPGTGTEFVVRLPVRAGADRSGPAILPAAPESAAREAAGREG
jgi:heavy metal sensor kinase